MSHAARPAGPNPLRGKDLGRFYCQPYILRSCELVGVIGLAAVRL